MLFHSLIKTIGNTPMVFLDQINSEGRPSIFAKVESFNPGGSIKDRTALSLIEAGEKSGLLKPGGTVLEPTSGNTGVGLAWIGALKGYRVVLTMPETMSIERQELLRSYGAELILTKGSEGMKGAIEKAQALAREKENIYIPQQFTNLANPMVHEATTGPEIWEDLKGNVDVVISPVGTGGTITGVGQFLKKKNEKIQMIAIEPKGSPVLSGGAPGLHKIQGIGAGFVPDILDRGIIDEVIAVTDEEAMDCTVQLSQKQGLSCGISSGAALCGAMQVAKRKEFKDKNIVAILPDTGERYLSMGLLK